MRQHSDQTVGTVDDELARSANDTYQRAIRDRRDRTVNKQRDIATDDDVAAAVNREGGVAADGSSSRNTVDPNLTTMCQAQQVLSFLMWIFAILQCILTIMFYAATGLFKSLNDLDNTAMRLYISSICAMTVNMAASYCTLRIV